MLSAIWNIFPHVTLTKTQNNKTIKYSLKHSDKVNKAMNVIYKYFNSLARLSIHTYMYIPYIHVHTNVLQLGDKPHVLTGVL